MDNIYMLSDKMIPRRIGNQLKQTRLRQNITQQNLAEETGVSLSSIKKIEKGEIGSFDTWLRVLRILGLLDALQPLVNEPQPSPSEYYEMVHSSAKKIRKRAAGSPQKKAKEELLW
ncbi:MAG: helix-turn-helix domain-containing protein [Bacteroidales bacterium]|nr:helix-turn-helix domain-containing protein [Bacteroidales bacterium]